LRNAFQPLSRLLSAGQRTEPATTPIRQIDPLKIDRLNMRQVENR